MTPRVTEAHLQARREQILTAAASSFAKSGLHAATMQDIATQAELSAGALYRYFGSKEEIIEAIATESRLQNAAAFDSARQEGDTARALSALCVAFFTRLQDPDVRASLPVEVSLWSEAAYSDGLRKVECEGLDGSVEALQALIGAGQARGDIDPRLDAEAVARALASTFLGLQLQVMLRPEIDIPAYLDAVVALCTGSFWTGADVDRKALTRVATA